MKETYSRYAEEYAVLYPNPSQESNR
jgi:hypothetical protein